MRRFLVLSLGFYAVALGLGVLLRGSFLQPMPWLNFSHALHAHSHTLYFGWAGLGLLTLAFERVGATGGAARGVLWALTATAVGTFAAFLHSGYALPGIVVMTFSLVVWTAAVVVWWRTGRGQRGVDLDFLRVGMIYVLLALGGAVVRVVLLATKAGTAFHAQLSVYFFLHAFAWFFLFSTFGLLLSYLQRRGVAIDERWLRRALWVMAATAWLGAPLGVNGGSEGALGIVARIGAAAVTVGGIAWVRALWSAASKLTGSQRATFRCLALWYAVKVAMEGTGVFGLATWATQARHPAILYLHVLLVGFVSLGLLVPLLDRLGRPLARGLWLHNVGLVVMAGGIAVLGAAFSPIPGALRFLQEGYVLAALGGVPIVFAAVLWLLPARLLPSTTSLNPSEQETA